MVKSRAPFAKSAAIKANHQIEEEDKIEELQRRAWLNSQSVSVPETKRTNVAIASRLKAPTEIEAVYFSVQARDKLLSLYRSADGLMTIAQPFLLVYESHYGLMTIAQSS